MSGWARWASSPNVYLRLHQTLSVIPWPMSSVQGRSWTSALLWCVQVRARTTQTSTAVWIQCKRFYFQAALCHHFSCQTIGCGAMLTVALCHVHKHKQWFSPNDPAWFDAAVLFPVVCVQDKHIIHPWPCSCVFAESGGHCGGPGGRTGLSSGSHQCPKAAPPTDQTRGGNCGGSPGRSKAGGPFLRRGGPHQCLNHFQSCLRNILV